MREIVERILNTENAQREAQNKKGGKTEQV